MLQQQYAAALENITCSKIFAQLKLDGGPACPKNYKNIFILQRWYLATLCGASLRGFLVWIEQWAPHGEVHGLFLETELKDNVQTSAFRTGAAVEIPIVLVL
uniref:Uncharacterized protein n=1 Tax=Romanomermis culicivorax TaxID=13658 RepID=A0A915I8C8_ROMCU